MRETTKTDLVLGTGVIAFALFVLTVWIPADVESGIFNTVRRRTEIGDAFAPVLAGAIILLGGVLLVLETLRKSGNTKLSASSIAFALALLALFTIALTFMRYAGPATVTLFESTGMDYRALRDTAPWKYLGFVLGGMVLVTTPIAVIERRLGWKALAIGMATTLILIAIYDLPFDDLILPPNGDV